MRSKVLFALYNHNFFLNLTLLYFVILIYQINLSGRVGFFIYFITVLYFISVIKLNFISMKTINVTYWVSTSLIALLFAMSSIQYMLHSPEIVAGIEKLGYPSYLLDILGTAKILGAIVLLLPRFPRLKEWAYAGFVFDLIGAFWSHNAVGDYAGSLFIVVPLILLGISYFTFHKRQTNLKTATI